MRFRFFVSLALVCALLAGALPAAGARVAQQPAQGAQSGATDVQRLEVLRQRLDGLRRQLNSAISALNAGGDKAKKDEKKSADDPATRLRGLEKEVGQLLSEVNDLRARADRAEKYDNTQIEKLEGAAGELNERVEAGLRGTAGERRAAATANASGDGKKKKKGGSFFGRLIGRGGDDEKYADLIGQVSPGRDRELFEEATKLARKSNYEGSRLLYDVIVTTYPDSPYLPYAKLAKADTFYLEGTTSALIQAANSYQEWLTFFPTDPLADEVMLKVAEVEMRQMGLPDRDVQHARKAEQRLKALLQQFPNTNLRPDVQVRLNEVQENLGMHSFQVGNFYYDRYERGVAPNPKGAQSRYREIVEKYPNFSRMDRVLYLLATTYIQEEEPDEAAKYFQQLARNHPDSEFAEKAKEQLDAIGAATPEADPKAKNKVPPPERGMMRRFLDQVIGSVPATIEKDGILIRKESKERSLIDEVIAHQGKLPVTTPTAPYSSTRVPAVARPAQTNTPQQPANKQGNEGVRPQPTRPAGQPATGDTPTQPQSPPPGR